MPEPTAWEAFQTLATAPFMIFLYLIIIGATISVAFIDRRGK